MEMPDLPPAEKRNEERKQLQFWINHCHELEKRTEYDAETIDFLKDRIVSLERIIKFWFPQVMKLRAASIDGVSDENEFEFKILEMFLDIDEAASLMGEIPTRWTGFSNTEEDHEANWRIYP